MKLINKYKELIHKTEESHRDIQIERLLDDSISKNINDQFIEEVRDHLSTIVNRNEFTNVNWFLHPDLFTNVNTCNCHVHIETQSDMRQFLFILYSLYRRSEDFNVEEILNPNVIDTLLNKK